MNRIFYILAIFFVGLYTAVALFQSLLVSWFGPQVFLREAILPWFFLAAIIYVVNLIFILKYYYNKEYWFAFSSLFIVALISLGHSFNVYNLFVTKELGAYYIVTYFILLVASVLYSLSLIFSKAAERPWLK